VERASKTLVVDASVVLKWFVPERDTDKAIKLRDWHIDGHLTLMAPDLLVYEVANALRYHPDITEAEIREDVEALFMLDIDLIQPSTEFIASTAEIARRQDISIYDSSYLTLANLASANLVTSDKKLQGKATGGGRVIMLQELDEGWTL
jgi:predicted nucleic acid-binding protein